MNDFQKRLTELMKRQGMTQRMLAERLGIGEAAISKYINTARTPHTDVIANMATALNTTVDYLLGRDDAEIFNYLGVKRMLARNANAMSSAEKRELVEILFGGK